MADDDPRTLVSTAWLADRLDDPKLRIIDASWHLPGTGREGLAEYRTAHIPSAQFFDIDAIVDPGSELPHTAPSPQAFATAVGEMGIGDDDQVVVYDGLGLFSAARVWFLFRRVGHKTVAVLDGGFPKWRDEGRPVSETPPSPSLATLTPRPRPGLIRDAGEVAAASRRGDHEILDARPPERFRGDGPEPRAGLRAGHIPGSKNLPFTELLNADGTMKEAEELKTALERAGVTPGKPVITTCGSGVTAAIINLAYARLGRDDHTLYDGSWSEWGARDDLDIATG